MKVLVINGPNLNMLGKRPKEHYGSLTLDEINERMIEEAGSFIELSFFQSNYEGAIIDKIQEAVGLYDAIIINPAGYTHTSVSIRDALEIFPGIKIEVHLSDVDNRDEFRKVNYIRDVCEKAFTGGKIESYLDSIKYLKYNK